MKKKDSRTSGLTSGIMAVMPDNHVCLFCGESIEQTKVDPCSAVLAASLRDQELGKARGARMSSPWWRRPPGQYWMHAACLRRAAHPSVPLHFLDLAEGEPGRQAPPGPSSPVT